MPNQIPSLEPSGLSFYAILLDEDARVWNGAALEALDPAHWANYAILLADPAGSGVHCADMPAGVAAPGLYKALVYLRVGAAPAPGDTPADTVPIAWMGTGAAGAATVRLDLAQAVPTAPSPTRSPSP